MNNTSRFTIIQSVSEHKMTGWDPVVVQLPMAGRQTIHGPYAALMALLIDWPERRSAYHRAFQLCTNALDDPALLQKAREAFQHACIQAGTGPIDNPHPASSKRPRLEVVAGTALSPRLDQARPN